MIQAESWRIGKSRHKRGLRRIGSAALRLTAILALALDSANMAAASDSAAIAWKNAQQFVPGLSKDVVDSACREGSVMLYSLVLQNNPEDVLSRFRQLFPCVVLKTFTGSSGVLAQRYSSEFQAGVRLADAVMNSSPQVGDAMADKKMLAHWTPPTGVLIPEMWKNEGYWYALGLGPLGVAWNTQLVDARQKAWLENLKSWDQLPSAPFSSSVAIVNVRAGGTSQLPLYFMTQKYGASFVQKVAALKPSLFSGVNPLVERLAAGEFALALGVPCDTSVASQWLNGAPVQWIYPEPALAVPYFMAINAMAPHPNAARLLEAWSLSADGQTAWVNGAGFAPVGPAAHDQRRYSKESWYKLPRNYYNADWHAISEQLNAEIASFDKSFGR